MSGDKTLVAAVNPVLPGRRTATDPQTEDLMRMAARLGRRDRAVLLAIVRRASEISETEGEDVALAVLDQIQGILAGRNPDA